MKRLKKIEISHILGILKFLIALIPSLLYKAYLKIKKKDLWLFCETKNTARDNGLYFYEYIVNSKPEIISIYAINKKCPQFNNVKNVGKVVNWGSIKHYFYYMSATNNLSSHKEGNPNHFLFTMLHLYLNLYNNRIFLQHGIIKDDIPMFYYKNAKFKGFVCGAHKEYQYIKEKYGYNEKNVWYTGLARFDKLHDIRVNRKQILVIPTWRNYLDGIQKSDTFRETAYFKSWNSFLNNDKLIKYIKKNNITLIFYPHQHTQKYLSNFSVKSKNIKVTSIDSQDIQELLKTSSLMITDYSSVFFDFAYMKKPTIYYQFDYEMFFTKHRNAGYFDHKKDCFGPVCFKEEDLIDTTIQTIENNYKVEEKHLKKINSTFVLNDKFNCQRIYEAIINLKR